MLLLNPNILLVTVIILAVKLFTDKFCVDANDNKFVIFRLEKLPVVILAVPLVIEDVVMLLATDKLLDNDKFPDI
jgi:hypothetical protein